MPDPTATQPTDARPAAAADDTATGGRPAAGGFAFPPPDRPGDLGRLGRYRVLKELGRGGMGAVFLGHDDQLGRRVAVKVMLPQYAADPVARQRFLREARTAAAVKSEHVIDIYDVDEAGGLVYIAMRFLDGLPLDEYLRRRGRLTVPQVLRVGRETADGLAAAHATGLIHRDIKPANLWLEVPNGRVVVLDFGLAKPVADGGAELTNSGAVVGTPGYMAPEQARGNDLDGRADLFSLGCVMYRLATGHPPFPGPNVIAVLAAVLADTPRPVWDLAPDVPPPLADLIHRLLAKNPDDRPPTAAAVSAALAAVEFGLTRGEVSAADPVPLADAADAPIPVASGPEFRFEEATGPQPVSRPPARWSLALPASLAGAAVVLAAAGVAAWVATRPGPAPPAEATERPPPPTTRPPTPRTTDDRDLARWAVATGGKVVLAAGPKEYAKTDLLPPEPFRVRGVYMWQADPVADDDLDRITPADQLVELDFRGADLLTDAGVDRLTRARFVPKLTRLSLIAPRLTDAGSAHLGRFTGMRRLWLHRAPGVTDGGLAFLAKMPALILLDLSGCVGITGDGLRFAPPRGITRAVFDQCKTFDDAGPAHLAGWPELADLNLAGTAVTDDGVVDLAAAPKLAELNLSGTGVTDAAVESLSVLPLTSLQLSATGVTDTGVRAAARMPRLKHLNLDGAAAVTDAGLAALHATKTLRILNLTDTGVSLAGVRAFKAANPTCTVATRLYDEPDRKAAEWVLARHGQVTASRTVVKTGQNLPAGPFELRTACVDILPAGTTLTDLDTFRDCDRLADELQLGGPVITDEAVKKLAGFTFAPRLKSLVFNSSNVTDDGLEAVAGFRGLTSLFLRSGRLTGRGLAVCRELPHLATLNVSNNPVTDAGVKHLRGLNLTVLDLSFARVTDAATPDLGTLTRLKSLLLHSTGVTDAGLPALAGCPALTTLDLTNTGVTDAGLDTLAGFAKLTTLYLPKTNVTADGVRLFSAAVPGCKVVWDGGEIPPATAMQRAKPALAWALAGGFSAEVEAAGKVRAVTAADDLPAAGRLVSLNFNGARFRADGADTRTGAGVADAVAAGLKDLPPSVWADDGRFAFCGTWVAPGGWATLAAVPGVRAAPVLEVADVLGDPVVPHLARFSRAHTLTLQPFGPLTADDFRRLAELPHLRRLRLNLVAAKGQTVEPFDALRPARLTELAVAGAPNLGPAVVPALAAVATLTRLDLRGCGLVAADADRLAAALPKCRIVWDEGVIEPREK